VVVYPPVSGWRRGGGTLDAQGRWTPRLIHAAWHQVIPTTARREEHVHDVYHVGLVHTGEGSMLLDGERVATSPGSLLVVSPGQPHCFLLPPGERSVYSEVTFEVLDAVGKSLRRPLEEVLSGWTGRDCPAWVSGGVAEPALQKTLADAIGRVVAGGLVPSPRREFVVNRGLLVLLEAVSEAGRPLREATGDPIEEAAQRIERQMHSSLSVRRLAEDLGMSPNHLIRRFGQRYGVTPLAYRQQLRIDAARRLLEHTHHPIKVVAEWTGFRDVHYFTRMFTNRVGMPPGAYRRAKRAGRG